MLKTPFFFFASCLLFFYVLGIASNMLQCCIQWGFIRITMHLTIARIQEKRDTGEKYSPHKYLLLFWCVCRYYLFCMEQQITVSQTTVFSLGSVSSTFAWIVMCAPLLRKIAFLHLDFEYYVNFFCVNPSYKLYHSEVLCSVFISKISLCFIIITKNVCQPVLLFCNSLLYCSFWLVLLSD